MSVAARQASFSGPSPKPGIEAIATYKAGASKGHGPAPAIKLSSNEGALGPSPRALVAARNALGALERYPDGTAAALREALGSAHGLDPARIVCGNGSDELLALLAQTYLAPGDEAVMTAHTFAVYEIVTRANGATVRLVPDPVLRADVDAILSAVTERTRLVFLANPNNPTGTYLTAGEVERLQAGLPEQALLILDGAYAEYVTASDYDAGAGLVERLPNVVMTRTFSKIHALAALRLGWAYMPAPVAEAVNRIRAPFNVNTPAQAAGIAAIADKDHAGAALAHNEHWRPLMAKALRDLGLEVTEGVANFVFVQVPEGAPVDAAGVNAALREAGVLVRPTASFGLPRGLRITVGPQADIEQLLAVLPQALGGGGPSIGPSVGPNVGPGGVGAPA